jgi:hypothetical protein
MKFLLASLAVPVLLVAGCSKPAAPAPDAMDSPSHSAKPPTTGSDPIASAMSAAPASVSKDATIVTMDDKGAMKTARKGNNGWTCMPDTPQTPGPDPMCVDKGGMAWMMAWMTHKDPPKDTVGFGYMLMGGSDADNDDPFATAPPVGKSWVHTGPHVMVFNIGTNFADYPTTPDNTKAPYVMFPNTPYAHLMIPVK